MTFKVSFCFYIPQNPKVVQTSKANDETPQLLQNSQHFPFLKCNFGKAFEIKFHACNTDWTVRISLLFCFSSSSYNQKKKWFAFVILGITDTLKQSSGCFPLESKKKNNFREDFPFCLLELCHLGGEREKKGKQAWNLERTSNYNLQQYKHIISLSS